MSYGRWASWASSTPSRAVGREPRYTMFRAFGFGSKQFPRGLLLKRIGEKGHARSDMLRNTDESLKQALQVRL